MRCRMGDATLKSLLEEKSIPMVLQANERAPQIHLPNADGTAVTLGTATEEATKKTRFVVFFYPKDMTPGCTREAVAFSAAREAFAHAGAHIIGISKDSAASHAKFRDKYALRIPLLSDVDLTVHKAFGVYGEKTMYGKKVQGTIRSTFVIDASGMVSHVFSPVRVDGHVEAVLAALSDNVAPLSKKSAERGKNPAAASKIVAR